MRRFSLIAASSMAALLTLAFGLVGCSLQEFDGGDGRAGGGLLGVGDPAPPLNIGQWVNGEPNTSGFQGHVHVVEFWATWCGPCKVSMPHLSQLQDQYGDQVTIIGITNEDDGTVDAFLASQGPDGRPWGEVISYRLATDNNDATNVAYMKAADQRGIPTAFIVGRQGTIEWIGHPGRIDDPLRRVVEAPRSSQSAGHQSEPTYRLAGEQNSDRAEFDGI